MTTAVAAVTVPTGAAVSEDTQDARRWQAMRQRLEAADFAFGDPPHAVSVFEYPEDHRIGAGPEGADALADAFIREDAARAAARESE